jgi:hypothetical protein
MDAENARRLDLHEMVVWIPDGIQGEVIEKDANGIRVHWADGQVGYYQFTDLLSQIERVN